MCEKGIFVLETHKSLLVPQTSKARNVAPRNQIFVKINMYCTNFHCMNHDMDTCINKKKEEPTIIVVKFNMHVGKPPKPLHYPCHTCGIMAHKLMHYSKFSEM